MAKRQRIAVQEKTALTLGTAYLTTVALVVIPVSIGLYAALFATSVAKNSQPGRYSMAVTLGETVNQGLSYSTIVGWGSPMPNPTPAYCGNGRIDAGEQCDPPGTACTAQCKFLGQVLWTNNYSVSVDYFPGPVIADINNDGKLEILMGGFDPQILAVGSNGQELWRASYGGGKVNQHPTVADINNDGVPEILYVSYGFATSYGKYGGLIALDNHGNQLWHSGQDLNSAPVVADLDGDNAPEIMVGGYSGSRMDVYSSEGKFRWSFGGANNQFAITQLQNPGRRVHEVIAGKWNSSEQHYEINALDASGKTIWVSSDFPSLPAVGNLDSDLNTELVGFSSVGAVSYLTALNETGVRLWSTPVAAAFERPIIANKLVWVTDGHNGVQAYTFDGQKSLAITYPVAGSLDLVGLHDMDGQLGEEIIASQRTSINLEANGNHIVVFNQRGERVWELTDAWIRYAAVADINRDGKMEVVVVSAAPLAYGQTSINLKIVVYTFPQSRTANIMPVPMEGIDLGNTNNQSAVFIRGDVNHDGRVDIADATANTTIVSCLKNAQGCENPTSLTCKVNQGLCYANYGGYDCVDARDANDDGANDLGDSDFITNFQLHAGARPPAPGTTLGPDPTNDNLGCQSY